MAEVVIAFRRPASMTTSEMRAWVVDRAVGRPSALTVSVPEALVGQGFRLRVETDDDAGQSAEDQLSELMMDMRLLGFQPAVVSSRNR